MRTALSKLLFGLVGFSPLFASAQTLIITNGVQTYTTLANTTVIMSNRCELRVTASATPLSSCLINLNSTDSFCVLQSIKPSVVVSTYLSQFRINGAVAVADSNCRVVQYGMGAVVIPHNSTFQPLQVFTGPHFTGTASSLSQYVYYKGTGLGAMNANISSFKLKRGYVATFAQTENGTGLSKCYVAQDGDMEVSILPEAFDDSVRFVYVTPWRWTSKKGIAGNIEGPLNVRWKYNWNLDQNSTRDLEYVPIRQTRWWPGLGQDWKVRGASQLLGYNEPDRPDQANMAVGDAIYSWPDLLATGLRLGAPAVSDGGRSGWLYPFLTQADAANLRVDFVPVHYYWCATPSSPSAAASQMYDFLKATYDQVKRPLWITEWNNGANWTSCGDPTYAQQQAAIAAMIEMLDNTPFVERYAPYNWVEDVRRLEWDDGSLTAAGVSYRDKVSPIGYVQALPDHGTRSFAELRFENNTLDTSGYGNNGITSGSPAFTNGPSGQALVFDGANTVVTLPPNVARNNAFTFAAWIKWGGGANWQRIFDFGNSTTHYMFLSPNAAGTNLRFAIRNGGSEQTVQTAMPPIDSWQHVAVTLGGTTARIYVNGAQVAQNTGMSILPSNFSPRVNFLGKSQFIADPNFNGAMDDVLITDYALSAVQIAGLQTNTPPQFTNSFFARGNATEEILYSNTMADTATDGDAGDTLIYSKAVGPAWLNIAADGTMTGTPTSADGGTNYFTVRVTDAAGQNGFALVTINVTVLTASGTWASDGSGNWSEPVRWSGATVATGAGQTANFSTINLTGNRTVTLDTARSIGALRFSDTASSYFNWTLTNSGTSKLTLDTGSATSPAIVVTNTATIGAPLAGTNGFTKSGPGTLILRGENPLSGTVNIDTSSATINDGMVRIVGPDALANASLIQIRNNNSGTSTLQLDGSAGDITINALISTTCRNSTAITLQNLAGTNIINGNVLLNVGGNSHNTQCDSGLIVFTGTNMYVGSLTGIRTNYFTGAGNHLHIGPILNSTNGAPISVTKSGTGALTLEAVNTYGNGTTLAGGKLIVNGTLPAGGLFISTGTTLGGHGTINSPVTIPAGATIAPGASVGKLTVNATTMLQSGSFTRMELNKAAGTNDQLRVVGTLAYGGTLIVTNLAGALGAGDSFQLFNPTSHSGSFSLTNLPPLPNGLVWQWTPATGTLSINATVALNPTNITAMVSGNSLQLSWPEEHTGWRLETNAVSVAAANAWFPLAGSTATNQMFLPVDPNSSNVFFRLVFP
jgi:autotransporter-associated beta strand protein